MVASADCMGCESGMLLLSVEMLHLAGQFEIGSAFTPVEGETVERCLRQFLKCAGFCATGFVGLYELGHGGKPRVERA